MLMSSNSIDIGQMKNNKLIRAIFSDYDGTLCSASAARDNSLGQNRIPLEVREVLQQIAEQIPVCIISSKDYSFLKETRIFAKVVSCLMGIETLSFASNVDTEQQQSPSPIRRKLLVGQESGFSAQSDALEKIAQSIESEPEFRSIIVDRKYTSDKKILAGITIDWRYSQNWDYYRRGVRHFISALVTNLSQPPMRINLYLLKYNFHPFVDVYVTECNKGTAFDLILSEMSIAARNIGQENECGYRKNNSNSGRIIRAEDVLYLGDSENDNPGFRKAGVSIGVRSDSRIVPELECQHIVDFDRLARFLWRLKYNHLRFKEEQLI